MLQKKSFQNNGMIKSKVINELYFRCNVPLLGFFLALFPAPIDGVQYAISPLYRANKKIV